MANGKQSITTYNLYLLLLVSVMMTVGCNLLSPAPLPCENGSLIEIPARPLDWRSDVLTPTEIQVQEGNTICFTASGKWDVGLGPIGPNGKEDWCECLVSERHGTGFRGSVGALVGRIGENGAPFLVGSQTTITAMGNGTLYLGSNDNLGPCDGSTRGSCYDDNKRTLQVCVEVK